MSEQGIRGVPGVPDGWELVHCLRIGEPGEIGLNQLGEPFAIGPNRTIKKVPIIRKIEQPARYRQFANAEEFDAFNHIRFRHKDRKSERLFASCYGQQGLCIDDGESGIYFLDWAACFARLEFDDGTPFGVKVEE